MAYKQPKNQVSYRSHYTPTHKLTRKERIWANTKLTAEAFAIMVFAFFFFTVIVHFIFK